MHVLVVTVVHHPGDARILAREIRALLDAGHQVSYAAPFTAYGVPAPPGVRPLDLPRAVGRSRLRALRAARSLIRREAPGADIVLLHDPELLLAAAGAGRAVGRTTLVWDVHEDTAAALAVKSWLPGPARRVLPAVVRAAERHAERHVRLLLAEDSYAERFARAHPVVPNTVPVPRTEPPPAGRDRAVYVGRLTRARGALELIEVGRLLAGTVAVHLVGPADADVAPLLEEAAGRGEVGWHGFRPNDEALGLLDGALAGLSLLHDLPNYARSRPTKVMEYMAHGVPVVTTPNPSSVELVEGYGAGLVVPFGDAAAAAAAVRRLREDDELRERCARAGRAAAVEALDWSRDGPAFVAHLARWSGVRVQ